MSLSPVSEDNGQRAKPCETRRGRQDGRAVSSCEYLHRKRNLYRIRGIRNKRDGIGERRKRVMWDEGVGRADSEASEVTWEGMIRSISAAPSTENGRRFRFLFERRGIIVDDVHGIVMTEDLWSRAFVSVSP